MKWLHTNSVFIRDFVINDCLRLSCYFWGFWGLIFQRLGVLDKDQLKSPFRFNRFIPKILIFPKLENKIVFYTQVFTFRCLVQLEGIKESGVLFELVLSHSLPVCQKIWFIWKEEAEIIPHHLVLSSPVLLLCQTLNPAKKLFGCRCDIVPDHLQIQQMIKKKNGKKMPTM